jgi:hypothetical protein
MRVELALLFNDKLLGRGAVLVTSVERTDDLGVFKASHTLFEDSAKIVLLGHANPRVK